MPVKENSSKTQLEDLTDTRPGTLVPDTLVSEKGGRRERESEWVGKRKTRPPERRKQVTTSEDEHLLEHCAKTMHVTCVAMSLDKLEP